MKPAAEAAGAVFFLFSDLDLLYDKDKTVG